MRLKFKPIDLQANLALACSFRRDSYVQSFGDDKQFNETEYIQWLTEKIAKDPWLAVHVWSDQKIVGQMEFGRLKTDPTKGYVNLYYLSADHRGLGLAPKLDEYATEFFRKLGVDEIKLSVSLTNPRAIRFYEKMGWKMGQARDDRPDLARMEKTLI